MTPEQIAVVETTSAALDLTDVAADFYRRAFEGDPAVAAMFTTDPAVQRERFATELALIVAAIRRYDDFVAAAGALGARHRTYGVRAVHFRLMGEALIGALSAALGDQWNAEVEQAWRLAYNLIAETMMTGSGTLIPGMPRIVNT